MIFQDPYSSLDPRMNIEDIISEPLYNYRIGTASQRRQKVAELLEQVELPKEAAHRYPFEFSGGQRQRIGIARALALNPECIFCDEPVSALDVSVQVQIINMLKRLQKERDLSYLFISHDLSVVYYMSDYIGIMYGGCIVEYGCSEDIYRRPLHPYTKLLLQSIPKAEPSRKKAIVSVLTEEKAEEGACAFYPRCSFSNRRCLIEVPVLKKYENNRVIACHYVEGGAV
jgi:oligopeptide/dipeptide ABC transporter, ATP-binding protein, C-terminal domain